MTNKKTFKKPKIQKKVFKKTATKKTATKKETTKKYFKKPKKVFDFATIQALLKDGYYNTALETICFNTTIEQQREVLITHLNKSDFRAYSMSMKLFNSTINLYKQSKNKDLITKYVDSVEKEISTSKTYAYFKIIRKNLVLSFIAIDRNVNSDFKLYFIASDLIYATTMSVKSGPLEAWKKQAEQLIYNFCYALWPEETKGLRLLYGKN